MVRRAVFWSACVAQAAFTSIIIISYAVDCGCTWRNGTALECLHSGVVFSSGHLLCYRSLGPLRPWYPGRFFKFPARGAARYWPPVLPAKFTPLGFRYGSLLWAETEIAIIDIYLWPPCAITAIPLLALGYRAARRRFMRRRRRRRALHGLCPSCGYDLTGSLSQVCPECGTAPEGTLDPPGSVPRP
jgi:hypothetical protein